MTAAENEQSVNISCEVHIQTYIQIKQLLSADCVN